MPKTPKTEPRETAFSSRAGIMTYLFPNPALHSFCLSLYVRAGSMFEDETESGITHLFEHLIFRSVNRRMGGTLYTELDRMGLCLEGCTYKEFVRFTISGAKEHFEDGAKILLQFLLPLDLSTEDMRLEKSRVKAEIREESERTTLDFFADGIVHKGTSLSRSIAGTAGSVERISFSRLCAFREKMLSVKNVFFYITGAVKSESAEGFCRALDGYPLSDEAPLRENVAPLSDGFFKRDGGVFIKNSKKHMVRLSVDVDTSLASDAALTLLYDVLFGEGESSRVHQALSESTGYIYSFRAGMELYKNAAVISLSYEITPSLLLPSVALLLSAIRKVKENAEGCVACVRAPYTDNAYILLDTDADLNWNRAYESKILDLPYASVSDRAAAYAEVCDEDLKRLAQKIFVPSNMTLTVKGDKKRVDKDALVVLINEMK